MNLPCIGWWNMAKLFYDDYLANSEEARNNMAKRICEQYDFARKSAERLGVPERLQQDEDYYNWKATIKGNKFNEFRYNKTFEDIETFLPLICSNRPSWSYLPREPLDTAMSKVVRQYKDFLLEETQFDFHYKLVMKDMFKFGTAYLKLCIDNDGKMYWERPNVGQVFLGDYTETDIWRQPRIQCVMVMDINDAEARWGEDFIRECKPTDDDNQLGFMAKMYSGFKELILGYSDNDSVKITDAIRKQWKMGRVVIIETEEQRGDKVMLSYLVNGKLAEMKWSKFPRYRTVAYRHHPQNKHALGISVTDMNKGYSDAVTSYIQSMLRYFNSIAKGIYILPKGAGIGKAEFEDILKQGSSIIEVADKYVMAANQAFRPVQINALPQGIIESVEFLRTLGDRQGGNTTYLSGLPGSSEDSGAKVNLLQQAGAARLKLQAQFNDDDGNYKLGKLVLHYIQTLVPADQIIRVVGENNPDGTPRFIDVNKQVSKELLLQMYQAALNGENSVVGVTMFEPQEVVAQYKLIEERVEAEAAQQGQVPTYMLNDLSAGRFDVSVQNSDVLPFNDVKRQQGSVALAEMGKISDEEIRNLYGFPTDPESMAKLPSRIKTTPAEQYMEALQQADPQQHQQIVEQMLNDLAQYQKVYGK